jgi:hypothetical protein
MLEITKESIEKATAKARIAKPLVKVIEFRRYAVTNKTTGANYEVKFYKIGNQKFADCTCPATKICYHIGASIGAHIVLAEQMHTATA